MALHGWVGAEDEILNAYAASCLKASEDDEFFAKFKKVDEYRPIIEGGPKLLFDTYLGHIREHNFENTFLENLEKFRINDSIGKPDLYTILRRTFDRGDPCLGLAAQQWRSHERLASHSEGAA